jgi:hypothetical protein
VLSAHHHLGHFDVVGRSDGGEVGAQRLVSSHRFELGLFVGRKLAKFAARLAIVVRLRHVRSAPSVVVALGKGEEVVEDVAEGDGDLRSQPARRAADAEAGREGVGGLDDVGDRARPERVELKESLE